MTEFQFQQAMAKFLTDAKFRNAIYTGNSQQMAEGTLFSERQRLLEVNRERAEIFADLLIINRLAKAIEGLPLTTALLGNQLWPIAVIFNQEAPPKHSKKYLEAMAFAQFLQQYFQSKPPSQRYLEDVLIYEMTSLELRFKFDGVYAPNLDEDPSTLIRQLYRKKSNSQIVPYRLTHNRIISLNYDIEALGEEVEQGRIPTTLEKRSLKILLHVEPSGRIEQAEINLPTLLFIEACDGKTTLSNIIENLALDLQQGDPTPSFQQGCLELCESLIERRIIAFNI